MLTIVGERKAKEYDDGWKDSKIKGRDRIEKTLPTKDLPIMKTRATDEDKLECSTIS